MSYMSYIKLDNLNTIYVIFNKIIWRYKRQSVKRIIVLLYLMLEVMNDNIH